MDRLPFRQIHLDFHTGDQMPGVGSQFSEENFKEALTVGHVSSITLFAKGHHGWAYFPSKVNTPHPTLTTNLLDRQLKVCEELGVRTQIYVSAGLDEHKAVVYPHLRRVTKSDWSLLGAHWHGLCLNNDEYLEILKAEVAEVMEVFAGRFDGIFMDICTPAPCVCPCCINSMLALGLDPENDADVEKHRAIVYDKYTKAINETVAKYDKDMPVFHNCGNVPRDDRRVAMSNTHHLELESLPTGGWGYDHFPLSAAYSRVLGKEFLGMTGKFHKSWGEFGGYKHPNALVYEAALSIANGAKCSVGDQLHPCGRFDIPTYRLIGKAYEKVEQCEKWCSEVKAVADVAIYTTYTEATRNTCPDVGANRMLLEEKFLYNIIDGQCDLGDYKVVIFPDIVEFDEELAARVEDYLAKGGKILLSGRSGLKDGRFFKDFGVEYLGENPLDATYMVPTYDMQPNGIASYLMYKHGQNINVTAGEVVAQMQNSYFNRSLRRFCSHANTPYDPADLHPGAVVNDEAGIAYIAWDIFDEYGVHGAYHQKRMTCDILDRLLGDSRTLVTDLPSNGVVTLMEQPEQNRYVNHLLYAVTKLRGKVEVIEDAIPIYDTTVSVRLPQKPSRVYLAPEEKDIPFVYENGVVTYKVEKFTMHAMVVMEK